MSETTRNSYDHETKLACVRAHIEEGMTSVEAMQAYGVTSKSSFFRWCAAYREGGPDALSPKKRGRPRKILLE